MSCGTILGILSLSCVVGEHRCGLESGANVLVLTFLNYLGILEAFCVDVLLSLISGVCLCSLTVFMV